MMLSFNLINQNLMSDRVQFCRLFISYAWVEAAMCESDLRVFILEGGVI